MHLYIFEEKKSGSSIVYKKYNLGRVVEIEALIRYVPLSGLFGSIQLYFRLYLNP
jgi:hypothetical protein